MVGIRDDDSEDPFIKSTLGTSVGLGILITRAQDEAMRDALTTQRLPTDLERFWFTPEALYHNEENWSAVLAVEIYFEAWIAQWLRAAWLGREDSENDIERRFGHASGVPRTVTNLITTYVPELIGDRFKQKESGVPAAFDAWKTHARDLRNQIAHGERLDVTREQARLAIESVWAFISVLKRAARGG